MMRDLDALASQARGYLVDKGCARSTIAHHGAAWKRLMSWCGDEGIGGHDHDAGRRLMEEVAVANADATRCLGLDKSRVLLLLSIDETGEPPDREAGRRLVVPAGLGAACLAHAAGPGGLKPPDLNSVIGVSAKLVAYARLGGHSFGMGGHLRREAVLTLS